MSGTLRWGILGCGNIARQFADSMPTAERGVIAAVGSRSPQTAAQFAAGRAVGASAGSYDEVIANRDIDAIYVALPNALHHEWTMKALTAGKHVLCEKPIAANAAQAREMFDLAEQRGLVLMEAFMYRCHPQTLGMVAAVLGGSIGKVKLIRTSFCFRVRRTEGNIRFNRDLAGGVLMDVGCYCINYSRLIAQAEPIEMQITAHLHSSGVDELAAGYLRFPNDVIATFTCGMTAQADNTAMICGDEGYIETAFPWKPPAQGAQWVMAHSMPPKMELPPGATAVAPPRQVFTVNAGKGLFALEADAFAAAVLDGAPPTVSREDSLGNMLILDELRKRIGVP